MNGDRIDWLCAHVAGTTVLDIGCGQGIASIRLAREGHRVTGVDAEAAALEHARAQLAREQPDVAERVTFALAEGGDLPYDNASFDTVLLGEVLGHQPDPAPLLREARRVLVPGGLLVVALPSGSLRDLGQDERLDLEPVVRALGTGFAVQRIEVGERWVGFVASAGEQADALADELDFARARIAHLRAEREELERALRTSDERAASLSRELAETTVELEDARERLARAEGSSAAGANGRDRAERAASAIAAAAAAEADPPAILTDDPWMLDRAGREALGDGDYATAATAFGKLTELEPTNAEHWLGLGRAYGGLRRLDAALEAIQRTRELSPGSSDALWQALHLTARLDDTEGFEALTAELGSLAKCAASTLERLAPLALRAGAHQLALAVGERLVALQPLNQAGLQTLACARWELGDEEGAAAVVAVARESDPRAVRAALTFARHRDELDEVPQLLAALDPPDGKLLADFASLFARRGQPRVALDLLDDAERIAPGHSDLAGTRARVEDQLKVQDGSWAPPGRTSRIDSRKGHVLHLVSHSLPHHTSGGTYRTQYITRAQSAAGLHPQVVTPLDFPWSAGLTQAGSTDELDGITYHRLVDEDPGDERLAARMARNLEALVPLVERLRPAVLHPHSDHLNALLALELRKRFAIPVVYEVRGFPEERRVRRPGSRALSDQGVGRRAMELECMGAADRIVTLADVMKRHIVSRGVPAEKIRIMPNGVDAQALQPAPRDAALARRLGLEDGETVLGYVSTFYSYEGIEFIVRATAELIRRGHRARALLVGDGREGPTLEALAEQLGIADAVVFTGRVPHDEVLAYYGLIDLFVCARRAEATSELVTPLKPFEAMAVERAVIVSDLAALREIVRDGETGRTFRPEDVVHLADVAEALIEDPAERRRLAAAGREWVARERTWDANGARYRALYDELGVI